jgi:deoxyribose-phosphate aldolase
VNNEGAANRVQTRAEMAPFIQHTKIEVGTTHDEMLRHAQECVQYGFDAAMVPGSWVELVARELAGTGIEIASALDFPTVGVMTSAGKAAEGAELARLGATQLDMGVQIGWLKSQMYDEFRDDIAGVVQASGIPIKVMLELPLLTPAEREAAIELAMDAGASYLKNASAGSVEIANPRSIRYLAERAREGVLVKASGGIKGFAMANALLDAGAVLLGTSAGIEIVTGSDDGATGSY